ncbi:MAG TPA: hemerythrin domain-containing protein [Terriglobia bacterium]|nr:hemerythrin domain-containing protein [Terriglobia bacterium]
MKATSILMEEHRYILRSLDVICAMADCVENSEAVDDRDVDCVLDFLDAFGDRHHQEKEEAVLFPALMKASHDEEHYCICQITFEHNQQRSLLEGIEEALRTRKGQDFVYYARRLAELVRAHIRSEEDEIFKRADAILSVEEDDRVARELAAYDSPHLAERLRELLKRLVVLELKYGIHPDSNIRKPHYA